jgi:hypothetical protein
MDKVKYIDSSATKTVYVKGFQERIPPSSQSFVLFTDKNLFYTKNFKRLGLLERASESRSPFLMYKSAG